MLIAALGFLDSGDEALILDPYLPACFEDTLLAEAMPVPVPLDEGKNSRTLRNTNRSPREQNI